MKKIKHEAELVKEGVRVIMIYAQSKGAVKFDATDSAKDKIEYAYRFLVHEKQIQPLARNQESQQNFKHKIAIWISKKLPEDHPLLN